ncbi:MAG: cytosine/creatinine deaminase [Solirubrobacteraceae bacterium]|jgi:cytosine deaminase|nr:cytosine/creatinine deaminase [Solirubrobacteraceae bacterium]
MTTTLLSDGVDAAGRPLDLLVDAAAGTIAAAGTRLQAPPGATVVDCSGMTLLPAPAEPHTHLDKAHSADRALNATGDLLGAVLAWHAYRPSLTEEDIALRARAAAEEMIAQGATAIRTHVDVGPGIELRALRALVELREELRAAGLAQLQVVALVSVPLTGEEGAPNRALLREAIVAGADVVGGAPHLDDDPLQATRELVAIAEHHDMPIDLHTDERLDVDALTVREIVTAAAAGRLSRGAVASHCVSLGSQTLAVQNEIAAQIAAAGVAVVALPQSNLYLQSRGVACSPARGLTAVRALLDAGAVLAAGADNVRDLFNPVGRSDPLDTAALLVIAGHLTPQEAWEAVSGASRLAMGLAPVTLTAGAPAEILVVRGNSLTDAVARADAERIVFHAGRCVARTAVTSELMPAPSAAALT